MSKFIELYNSVYGSYIALNNSYEIAKAEFDKGSDKFLYYDMDDNTVKCLNWDEILEKIKVQGRPYIDAIDTDIDAVAYCCIEVLKGIGKIKESDIEILLKQHKLI